MSVLQDILKQPISNVEIDEWLKQQAEKAIAAQRIEKKLGEAFAMVEKRDLICRWICVNADDYFIMRRFLGDKMDEITDYNIILRTGQFARYLMATVIVNRSIDSPVGYAGNELPEGMLGQP